MATALTTVAGAGLYGYLLTSINLPEQWGYWLIGGVVLGLLVGRWYALLGSLATFVILFTDPVGVDKELVGLLLLVYLPGAFLAIVIGVGAHRAIETRIVSSPRRGSAP